MTRPRANWTVAAILFLLATGPAVAQNPERSVDSVGVEVEIYNPADDSNTFCVAAGAPFWANVLVRPGDSSTTCDLACSPTPVAGGDANLATGIVNMGFDTARLTYLQGETNPDPGFPAVDGLLQEQNVPSGQVGWGLVGDWSVDGDPASQLGNVCDAAKITAEGWIFRAQFVAPATGSTTLRLIRETDNPAFELSFADACGTSFKESNGGLTESVDAMVYAGVPCGGTNVIFLDGFELGNPSAWSSALP